MYVSYFFRKRRKNAYSIEHIFEGLSAQLKKEGRIGVRKIEVSSIRDIFTNIFQARAAQSEVNHITGDIYYVMLGVNKKSTVLTIHDCVFKTQYSKWNPKYWLINFLWYQLPVRKSNMITTISEKTKKELIELTGVRADKIKVVPNFYDPRLEFVPAGFNNTCPRILQIGTKENKNLPRIITALQGINCELDIVGPLSEDMLHLLKENKIKYTNSSNIPFEQLKKKYEEADVVLFISTYEGFGMPIIEANVVGRPLITSNLSPMTEIAGDSAMKVNPYDILEIKLAIMQLLADASLRQQLVKNGLMNAERYNINTIANKYSLLYESMVK
ncbi:MAG: glycosyltransferase family 4 protein [Sphingobacteriales bacterium]|nr:glycosyltransferase family 4 protein [Sphingobacteriales bacterium]